MKLSEYQKTRTQKTIVYGAPFSGKSSAVALLAKHYNLIWFDGENGAESLVNPALGLTPEHLNHIELIQTKDLPHRPLFAELVNEAIKWQKLKACVAHGKLNCPVCNKENAAFT
ncbi:MAG: hypothetical protein ACRCUS_01810, partial [Anaerovoracaceae bacterium]